MQESLDLAFSQWLKRLADQKGCSIQDTSKYLCSDEIANRLDHYPALGQALSQRPIELQQVKASGSKCVTLSQQYDAMSFGKFIAAADSQNALTELFVDFPEDVEEAGARIDAFIEYCVTHGYDKGDTGKPNRSAAGLFVSTLLTSAFPKRFVDFRSKRWEQFSEDFGHQILTAKHSTYGQKIVEAGQFAVEVSRTNTFKSLWSVGEPLWIISGICMMMKRLK